MQYVSSFGYVETVNLYTDDTDSLRESADLNGFFLLCFLLKSRTPAFIEADSRRVAPKFQCR